MRRHRINSRKSLIVPNVIPGASHRGDPGGRSGPNPDDDRQRVLVVDPDPTVRERMRRAIERADGTVTEAASLAEAQALLHDRFDSLIVDHQLPDGDGLDLAASVWATTPEAHIVVCSDGRADLRPGWVVHVPRSNPQTAVG